MLPPRDGAERDVRALRDDNAVLRAAVSEALARERATRDVLRVIARSRTDVQRVLDTVAESAARLCETDNVSVYLVDGSAMRWVAGYGAVQPATPGQTRPISPGSTSGLAIIERRVVHIEDVATAHKEDFPDIWASAIAQGVRTTLAVPLLRDGMPIGTISAYRTEGRSFSQAHIALHEIFADQAVIAIDNARLFNELDARNKDLTDALQRESATAGILRVISSSPTDVQPVLHTIAELE